MARKAGQQFANSIVSRLNPVRPGRHGGLGLPLRQRVHLGEDPPRGGYWRGTGLHLRGNAELLLVGRRGKGLRLPNGPVDSLIVAPRRQHSRKPDESYRRLERLYGAVRRLELFSREHRVGWTAWGLEVGAFSAQLRFLEDAAG